MTIALVVLTLAVLALAYGRYQDRKLLSELVRNQENNLALPITQLESKPKFVSRETAWEMHCFASIDLYLHLLIALENSLKHEGFTLTRSGRNAEKLNADTIKRVARYIATEHYLYLSPMEPTEMIDDKVNVGERDGSNIERLILLSKGCRKQGWFIERSQD
ncbi:hypothetical protein I7V28_18935 [Lelliottia amnigena]|uniref:hypothetical protein n=1 Tax=Lelliottia TaxID=1330545 RepID=UPI00192A72F0|nr:MULTISPECIES: hypothetical protein [Lelliottia]MBL5885585.1 hypothetical protein [Lelliottia aquatilis]MBL5923157.1 hypothetical protein [Lelliottia amnigena]MBL5932073.1 hypothetical protein [Lelliottia amnigena]